MTWQIAATFGVLVSVIGALILTRVAPDMVLVAGLALLLLTGIVSPQEAFSGFSNEAVATIAALFVIAEGLRQTGALGFIGQSLLGRPRTPGRAQLRLMVPVAGLSAFLNNTPVVAMMMPVVTDWARRIGMSVSHLLLPLSYASILGGMLTLVGTSTTLVVHGLLLAEPTQRGLTMFEMAYVGAPVAVAGILYVAIAARFLPDRKPAFTQLENVREYTMEMLVEPSSPIVGKSVEVAGLRHLPGMYLMEIQRGPHVIGAVSPNAKLESGDRLVFVGVVESVKDLQKIPGLTPADDQLFQVDQPRSHRCLVEAVVSASSRWAGMTIRGAKFRTRYNAVVIAVSRGGERISKKIGDIKVQPGDTLLLETHPEFVDAHRNSRDFYLVSHVEDSTPVRHERAWVARGILLVMVGLVALEFTSMLKAACLAGIAMVLTRCLRVSQAKRAIDWGVLLAIGAGLGIGTAMQSSGAATLIADLLIDTIGTDPTAALIAIFGVTMVLGNLITTQAAAVLIFPVALATAGRLDVNFMPFAITLTVAAASAYATPIGYQTNLMIYGPGGYHGSDFLRIGGPLSLIIWVIVVVVAPMAWPF